MTEFIVKNRNLRALMAIGAFVSGVIIGIIALFLPPEGEIHSSVLIFIAQILVLCASCVGIQLDFGQFKTHKNED